MSSRVHIRFLLPILTALAVLALATTAQADYEQVGLFAQSGNAEQLSSATGAAVNTTGAGGVEPGSLYTSAGQRISRYSPKGEFKEAWGWNTVKSGPDQSNELQSLTVKATSGTYTLSAITAEGQGEATAGSKVVTIPSVGYGIFHVGDAVSGFGIPPGATITAVGPGTLELSLAAESTSLTYPSATETTAPIQAAASAAEVKAALLALEAFEAGDLAVSGGPGNAAGTSPYEVTFEGAFAAVNIEQMSASNLSLAGGSPSSSATVKTVSPGAAGYERCRPANGDVCAPQLGSGPFHEEGVGYFFGPAGVAVDQSTGYVYVLNKVQTVDHGREHNLIEVFSADGSEVIARFGDSPVEGETIATNPEKITAPVSIVVDESGTVYVGAGLQFQFEGYPMRVMCFRPETPGDYHHYAYCGRSHDLQTEYPQNLALDDAGHLYWANQEVIQERSLAEPNAAPLCTLNVSGALGSMTANPLTGEVFYFNRTESKRGVYRLKPCNTETGKFASAQARVTASPPFGIVSALALNPTLSWGPNRPLGVLYGADESRHVIENVEHQGLGYILAQAEVHPPAVVSESVSNTRTTSTILHAEVDPHGFTTNYVFQYLSEAQYEANPPSERFSGAMEEPIGGGEIGSGGVGEASTAIAGLQSDTVYRFRVVATSQCDAETGEPCVAEGEALAFATYPFYAPGLPDHRAYELVTPARKFGGEVIPSEPGIASCGRECKPESQGNAIYPVQSAPDGNAVSYVGQPFNPLEGAVNYDSYVSRRTEAGWRTTALIPALPPGEVAQLAFDRTLSRGLLGFEAPGDSRLEIQDTTDPSSTTPLATEPNHRSAGELRLSYGGHSADFSRIFFAANDSLTEATPFAPEPPDPGASHNDLYEWHEGQLTLVNVLPGNAGVVEGAKFVSGSPDTYAVSEDGSTVFFKDEAGNLYARIGGTETVRVSQSQRSSPDPVGFKKPQFWTASADGSRVLFSSSEELNDDAGTGPIVQSLSSSAGAGSFTLSYEGQTSAPIALDTGSNPKKPTAEEVREALEGLSAIGAGEVSVVGNLGGGFTIRRTGAMAASDALIEANGSGLSGGGLSLNTSRPGTALYEWHEGTLTDLSLPGGGGFQGLVGESEDLSRIYFVDTEVLATNEGAGLDSEGNPQLAEAGKNNLYSWNGGEARFVAILGSSDDGGNGGAGLQDWTADPAARTAEASPSGRFLAFVSQASLSGYDNVGPCGQSLNAEKTEYITVQAPCNEAFLYDSATGKLTCASCNPTGEAPLGKSTLRRIEGVPERLGQPRYLTDEGRLYFDSQDSLVARDTNEGVEDVYEHSPQGAGAEGTCEREAGCTRLISAGTEAVDSNLIAVDETGKNVFFDTRDELTLKDNDELLDVYDAREGGGIGAETEVARVECQGEACQPQVYAPNDPTPGSSSFEGAGNVKEEVKAKKHKKHKHKKHGKKKRHARAAKRNHGGAK
jgi:hypothetical protein